MSIVSSCVCKLRRGAVNGLNLLMCPNSTSQKPLSTCNRRDSHWPQLGGLIYLANGDTQRPRCATPVLWSDRFCRWVWLTLIPSPPLFSSRCPPLSSSNWVLIPHPLKKPSNTTSAPPHPAGLLFFSTLFLSSHREECLLCLVYDRLYNILANRPIRWIDVEVR